MWGKRLLKAYTGLLCILFFCNKKNFGSSFLTLVYVQLFWGILLFYLWRNKMHLIGFRVLVCMHLPAYRVLQFGL